MKAREVLEDIKKILILFILSTILMRIIFFKESVMNVIIIASSLYYLFIIPGFFILYFWKNELSFLERFIISFALSLSVLGISGYYFGLLGIKLSIFAWIAPITIILISLCLCFLVKNKNEK